MRNTGAPVLAPRPSATDTNTYRCAVDIAETENEFLFFVDVPGVKEGDLEMHFEKGVLTLLGKTGDRSREQARTLHREYGVGDLQRSFRIDVPIDAQRIQAETHLGTVTIHLPKQESAKPRKIPIRSK